ncbi:MAG TPA: hypothetical protein VFE98_04210 [Candidatus Bathyarchaeia archaeon]|nr:hypothetical protein [Candidatus Bathyarchaeia archaeon]
MPSRRFKLEFYDPDGVKHVITVDGQITREKIGKLLDMVELMAGTPKATVALALSARKFDRLASTIFSGLKTKEFTSTEAKQAFESSFDEKIPLSTVSTYLVRLVDRGVLERLRGSDVLHYRVKSEGPRQILSPRP